MLVGVEIRMGVVVVVVVVVWRDEMLKLTDEAAGYRLSSKKRFMKKMGDVLRFFDVLTFHEYDITFGCRFPREESIPSKQRLICNTKMIGDELTSDNFNLAKSISTIHCLDEHDRNETAILRIVRPYQRHRITKIPDVVRARILNIYWHRIRFEKGQPSACSGLRESKTCKRYQREEVKLGTHCHDGLLTRKAFVVSIERTRMQRGQIAANPTLRR